LSEHILDELKLIVHALLLGGGKALFAHLIRPRSLKLVDAAPTESGKVIVTYQTGPACEHRDPARGD
jgi:dihydrofolate reductase